MLGEEGEVAGLPVHFLAGAVDVQGLGEFAVLHGLDHLDDARRAGGGLGVADVGLDRAEVERVFAVLAVGGEQCLCLDGVAEAGAGAVGLDGVHVGGLEARVGQGLADDALLGGAVGGGQAVAGTVLVDRRTPHHGEDVAAVALCVGEPFQQEQSGALAPAGAVGGGREGLATPVRGEPALPAELHEHRGAGHHGDAARQGQ